MINLNKKDKIKPFHPQKVKIVNSLQDQKAIKNNNQKQKSLQKNKRQKIQQEDNNNININSNNNNNNKNSNANNQKEINIQNKKIMNNINLIAEQDKVDNRKIIVVLQKCNLIVARIKKDDVLLNSDDHHNYISKKLNQDPTQFRPDITHQSLLTLMDSPLNKAGKLQVYITTASNQVIYINPHTRIPRTYKRFAPLMVHLLKKLRIRAQQTSQTLLKVIQSPVTKHLPPQSLKIAASTKGRLVNFFKYAQQLQKKSNGKQVVLLVGGVAKTNPTMQVDYYDQAICVSKYSLSASNCIARMLSAYQMLWDIV